MSTGTDIDRIRQLLNKSQLTEEEQHWLLEYLNSTDQSELQQLMQEKFNNDATIRETSAKADNLLLLIHLRIEAERRGAKLSFLESRKRIMIAASIVLAIGIGAIFCSNRIPEKGNVIASAKKVQPSVSKDIAPGSNNAILTLSDGTAIVLDGAADGELTQQGSSKIIKINGQLAYHNTNEKIITEKPLYNTVSTSNGNQYQILLPDGSKVWLNAASSLRFPVTFPTTERRVEITGEAYFEVAPLFTKEAQKVPFLVKVTTASGEGYEVQVVGTHFNINAYDNEATIRTTLVEGKVKIVNGNQSLLLQPSQEAVLNKGSERLNVLPANVEEAIAWKMGLFAFHDANLQSIMRQLSRWYDVEVKFSGTVSTKLYNGSIRRQATLSQVLQILKLTGVKYSIEGRTVTISTS